MSATIFSLTPAGMSDPTHDCCQRIELAELPERHCCLQANSLIDTPVGPQRVDCLKLGDTVWGEEHGHQVPTRIIRIYRTETAPETMEGCRLNDKVTLGGCACLLWENHWRLAHELELPRTKLKGPIFDLMTDTGNYFYQGVLIAHREPDALE